MANAKNKTFKWNGPQARCNGTDSPTGRYDYYKSCTMNNETFVLDDFAIIRKPDSAHDGGVYRILSMYESHERCHANERFRGSVVLYPFARDLGRNVIPKDVVFDKANEVVEDFHITDASLEDIWRKCFVLLATIDDPVHVITDLNLDTKVHFSCRYKLQNTTLIPILSASSMEMFSIVNKFYTSVESTPSSGGKIPTKLTSSKRLNEITAGDKRTPSAKSPSATPNRKVKRNLNESFDSVPNSQESTPRLNYSIVDLAAGDDEPIKLKLRVSERQNPLVLLNKLKDDIWKSATKERISNSRKEICTERDETMDDTNHKILKCTLSKDKDIDTLTMYKTSRLREDETKEMKIVKSARKNARCNSTEVVINLTESPNESKLRRSRRISTICFVTPTKTSCDDTQFPTRRSTRSVKKPSKYFDFDEESPKKIRRTRTRESVSDDDWPHELDDIAPTKSMTQKLTPHKSNLKRNNAMTPKKSVYYQDLPKTDNEDLNIPKTPKRKTIFDDKSTPKTTKRDMDDCDEPKTPKTPRQNHRTCEPKTPTSTRKNTPSARAKMIRNGVITPSMKARATPVKNAATPLNKARIQLHVSHVPKALPCREKEFADIYNFLEGKLLDGCGGCMYVSGVPGTGKTATVVEIIKKLHASVRSGELPKFDYIGINGMKLSEPRQSYVEILKQLTGKTVHWEQAQSILDTKFTKPTKNSLPIVLLVDEIDVLCTKRQDVVYNLLDWPTKANTQLIVVTIANTMDLPERLLMGRITSRLGLTRLTFQAYTHKQLQEIVTKRLTGADAFNPDAIQLVARKVASVSGDARRALDICRRAAELAELEGKDTVVSIGHVDEALNAMITQPKVQAIKHCSRLQQLILQAVVAEVQRTGVEETNFIDVYTMLGSIAVLDGFQIVSCTVALAAVMRLGGCRLLLTDQKSVDINQKLILNVSPDDVYYALRKD